MELTIPRSIWLRGDNQASMLLRKRDGLRCCVGIFLSAIGVPDDLLEGYGSACEVSRIPPAGEWLVSRDDSDSLWVSGEDAPGTEALYLTNDDPKLGEPEREAAIARMFAEHGVTVTFIDEPAVTR